MFALKPASCLFLALVLSHDLPDLRAQSDAAISRSDQAVANDLITLGVTVMDRKRNPVTDLHAIDFKIFEDGQPQPIISVTREDTPVSVAFLVDNSGSMRSRRALITPAVMQLVTLSNAGDEFMVVNFNDDPFLDQSLTQDPALIKEALDRNDARGGTAMYNTVTSTSAYLLQHSRCPRQVLVLFSDGDDNASNIKLPATVRALQQARNLVFYAVQFPADFNNHKEDPHRVLETMARETGGAVFPIKNTGQMMNAVEKIAQEIRGQYAVTYRVKGATGNNGYRNIKIVARSADGREVMVETRPGYYLESAQIQNANSR